MPSYFGLMSGSQGSTSMPSQGDANPQARLFELGMKASTGLGLSDDEKLEQQALKRRVSATQSPDDGE